MPMKIRELGAPNPELKNSPIAWEGDEDIETLRSTLPSEPVCFFNDSEYAHGTIVQSGSVRLRCERGVWVPAGPSAAGRN
ncbi:MAG TPA: DUF1496 domain-containing protein [Gammaproteobacteria bacterium]|nr:DUF1496 domain-containing protein [Gammaproteobacteria bacterium]